MAAPSEEEGSAIVQSEPDEVERINVDANEIGKTDAIGDIP